MRLPSTSLKSRFALTFAVSVLALSTVLGLFIGDRATEQVRQDIGSSLAAMAEQVVDKLDRDVWARAGEVRTLAQLAAFRDNDTPDAVRAVLDELKLAIPAFAFVALTDASGQVQASAGHILEGVSIAHRPVFTEGSKGLFVGDVHDAVMLAKLLPNPSGEPMKFVDVSAPVLRPDGTLAGVLATHLSWAWAREIQDSVLKPLKGRRDVEMFVVSSSDTVLLGGSGLLGEPLRLEAVDAARKGRTAWTVEKWPDGRIYQTGAAYGEGHGEGNNRYAGLGWTVVARQPIDSAYAPIRSLTWQIILAGGALSLIFALFGLAVSSHVTRPLKAITEAAEKLRAGQDTPIPVSHGITDIESLSTSLRDMVDTLTRTENARSRMEVLATRDPLTGLLNRLGLEQHLETAQPRARRAVKVLIALCLDLDGFKAVNDTLGHPAGDILLKEIAARLRGCLRGEDVAARFGGDEFVVVLEDAPQDAALKALRVASRIIKAVNQPLDIGGHQARVGVSLGGAVWPSDGEDFKDVLRHADQALYQAKRAGKNRLALHAKTDENS